jgi:hypothetical protein
MFLAQRRHQGCDAGHLPTGDDVYVRVTRLDLATLGPLEKVVLLPDAEDPIAIADCPVGKIWLQRCGQGYSTICVLSPLGYNVSVQNGHIAETWVEYPTIHVTLPPGWNVIVESNEIDCHRNLPLMA